VGTTAPPVAAAKQPPRLFNPQTGKIAWPSMLCDEGYRDLREAVETAWAGSASAGGVDREEFVHAAEALLEELKSHVAEATPAEYVAARKFLTTLLLEAKSPTGLKRMGGGPDNGPSTESASR